MKYEYQRRAPGGQFRPVAYEIVVEIFADVFIDHIHHGLLFRLFDGLSVFTPRGWEYRLVTAPEVSHVS